MSADARLTAYLLGLLPDDERREFEELMGRSPELRRSVEECAALAREWKHDAEDHVDAGRFVEALDAAAVDSVFHVLGCPECRLEAQVALAEAEGGGRSRAHGSGSGRRFAATKLLPLAAVLALLSAAWVGVGIGRRQAPATGGAEFDLLLLGNARSAEAVRVRLSEVDGAGVELRLETREAVAGADWKLFSEFGEVLMRGKLDRTDAAGGTLQTLSLLVPRSVLVPGANRLVVRLPDGQDRTWPFEVDE
ncbi:MAG: hypothetical protein GY716_20005 [bacterium]|nr:hypothetical protein [bacterium]